jgi:hypothetical protein
MDFHPSIPVLALPGEQVSIGPWICIGHGAFCPATSKTVLCFRAWGFACRASSPGYLQCPPPHARGGNHHTDDPVTGRPCHWDCRRFRLYHPRGASARIIVMIAFGSEVTHRRAISLGAHGLSSKPFNTQAWKSLSFLFGYAHATWCMLTMISWDGLMCSFQRHFAATDSGKLII